MGGGVEWDRRGYAMGGGVKWEGVWNEKVC